MSCYLMLGRYGTVGFYGNLTMALIPTGDGEDAQILGRKRICPPNTSYHTLQENTVIIITSFQLHCIELKVAHVLASG